MNEETLFKVLLVLSVVISLVVGGLAGYGAYNAEPERHVTVKVAAFPSSTSTADDYTSFENLNRHEQDLFLKAVEEADGAFEEADTTLHADSDVQMFNDVEAVEYGGAVYPVFVVGDSVDGGGTIVAAFFFMLFLGVLTFIACSMLSAMVADILVAARWVEPAANRR